MSCLDRLLKAVERAHWRMVRATMKRENSGRRTLKMGLVLDGCDRVELNQRNCIPADPRSSRDSAGPQGRSLRRPSRNPVRRVNG